MQLTVSARHMELDAKLRLRAEEILRRLGQLGVQAVRGHLILDVVGGLPWAEMRIEPAGSSLLVATATADDHRTALDLVSSKMRRQVRRVNTRLRSQRQVLAS